MKGSWKVLYPIEDRGRKALFVLGLLLMLLSVIVLAIFLPRMFWQPVPYSEDLPTGTYAYVDVIGLERGGYSYISGSGRAIDWDIYTDVNGQTGWIQIEKIYPEAEVQRGNAAFKEYLQSGDTSVLYVQKSTLELRLNELQGKPMRMAGMVAVPMYSQIPICLDASVNYGLRWSIICLAAALTLALSVWLICMARRERLRLLCCCVRLKKSGEDLEALAQYGTAQNCAGLVSLSRDYLYCPINGLVLRRKDIVCAQIKSVWFPSHGYEYTLKVNTSRRAFSLCTVSDQSTLAQLQFLIGQLNGSHPPMDPA